MDSRYKRATVTIQPVSVDKDVLISTTVEHIKQVNS